ncbi:11104_t:CDS:2 [Paraglomus occultum]|uniref:11104_t:CDS:1 n=1 Tax=Paraglomus occultum TaxID=144539 RepID=A0A9N9A923_9GLOM|nr:11104_t:CDS:2 [Paraglomus occultum]
MDDENQLREELHADIGALDLSGDHRHEVEDVEDVGVEDVDVENVDEDNST